MGNMKSRKNAESSQINIPLINKAFNQYQSSKRKPVICVPDSIRGFNNKISNVHNKGHHRDKQDEISIKRLQKCGFL